MRLLSLSSRRLGRVLLLAAVATVAPLASGCGLLLIVLIAPFDVGKPGQEPEDLVCPIGVPEAGELPPLPDAFSPSLPTVPGDCDVGNKTLQRLNRAEYDASVRDLTTLDLQLAAQTFPVDDSSLGFDNNAEILATSPLLVEKLEGAARVVIDAALQRPGEVPVVVSVAAFNGTGGSSNVSSESPFRQMGAGGTIELSTVLPEASGSYKVRVRAANKDAGDDLLELVVDGDTVLSSEVKGTEEEPELLEVDAELDLGPVHRITVKHVVPEGAKGGGDLLVDFVEIEGPFEVTAVGADPISRQTIVSCDVDGVGLPCALEVVTGFARRAWRRPVDAEETARLQTFLQGEVDAGDSVEDAMRTGLVAVLLSPSFLFRVELDADLASDAPHALSDHELATRLSYFLWSSIPDDRLLALADRGALQDPDVLAAEARRMLDDPRSRALVENFAGQWLFVRALNAVAPDPNTFPDFDESLRTAMKCETQLTFDRFLRDPDLSALDLLDLPETFVNDRLAQHYGLSPPPKTLPHGWGVANLHGTHRGGILTQGSLLTVTSHATRTSPTRRGKWILDNMMCTPPPPPPPNVMADLGVIDEDQTVAEVLAQHRDNPACRDCHQAIDPLGLALERFDGIGRYRGTDNGLDVQDSQLLDPNDPTSLVEGPDGLRALLKDDPLVPSCMAQRTLTYALGRGLDPFAGDNCTVQTVTTAFAQGGYRLPELMVEVVKSPAFRMRRADPTVP